VRNAAITVTATDWTVNDDGSANIQIKLQGSCQDKGGAFVLSEPYYETIRIPADHNGAASNTDKPRRPSESVFSAGYRSDPRRKSPL
jgi:hypothetical protein